MILQNLLEDKRYEWQKATQEQILNNLLCKSHKYKAIGQRNDKLVMVFGKSHAGKTTFILSLLGIAEDKLSELNKILRAGVEEGKSSTSTAIVYQKSEDDCFAICERGMNELSEYEIVKCTKDEFIRKIQETRVAVEKRKRNNELVLYLYIPCSYFEDGNFSSQQINILDVPGYETTNSEERYHTEIILNKYMSVSALNIVVRSIYDINDLRYFCAPNRDDYTKLVSGRYIVVTTRSYSQESIFKYFLIPSHERKNTFEEMLCGECQTQFERVFGSQIPAYFPVDIGESFNQLINTKITNRDDREYLITYRNKVFEDIYQCIHSKQSNTLINWVKEVIDDEQYYGCIETEIIDKKLDVVCEALDTKTQQLHKKEDTILRLVKNLDMIADAIEELINERNSVLLPNIEKWIDDKVNICSSIYFEENFKWKEKRIMKDVSEIFTRLFLEMLTEQIEIWCDKYEIISEKMKKDWKKVFEEVEIEIRNDLNEVMNSHKVLKVLNPSNKQKIDIGKKKMHEKIPTLIQNCHEQILKAYDEEILRKRKKEYNPLKILLAENRKKVVEIKSAIKELEVEKMFLEQEKRVVELRVKKDKTILSEYRKIAHENFVRQRDEIIEFMNKSNSKEKKVEYLILLGLIHKDYRKIVME